MAQPPPDVSEDECLPEYRHLFCPDLLRDKVAFVTGGGSGIGFRIAEIFMRHGCHTVIASRSLPRVSMAARKLAAATGQRCLPLSLDVRAPPAITAAVDQALKEFGKIDILINCAAGNFLCPASTLSFNAFKTVMDIDTLGTFNTSRVLYEKFFRENRVWKEGCRTRPFTAASAFSEGAGPIGYIEVHLRGFVRGVAHATVEPQEVPRSLCTSWRPRKAGGMIQSESEGLRNRHSGGQG
ncbi:peroxisomal 2,4-dienoyl-CoA reductase [(3E)-enoyl-CoA-producing] isoform X6 [Acinonyx jubatus]|uniref:Peroxisomal 2,4-dienoyl-CoA reductase [(3E)-enoyl-CoA-producing] n=1 Tax=Acinonyx jubatus TaxID=32536 RepID=A0A6I9ZW89_ACIJB|nr:peroxisomal 2,4-dienoyl-CoA reductase [(3E)-enoyl-CoA-producing] isoform X6 [Acinonyx jubatus]